jgi:type I restriction enzyme M protein
LVQRDKVNLDIFWIKDESLEDSDNLPEPDVILQEIIEDLESALAQLRGIAEDFLLEPPFKQGSYPSSQN